MRRLKPYLVIASMLAFAQASSASEVMPRIVVVVAPVAAYVQTLAGNTAQVQGLLRPGQDPHEFSLSPSQAQMLEGADILIIPDLSMSPAIRDVQTKHPKLHLIELSKLSGASPLPYEGDNPWVAAVKKKGGDLDEDAAPPPLKSGPVREGTKRLPGFDQMGDVLPPATAPTVDPHFWLDPERMAAIAPSLAEEIGAFSPANRSALMLNATHLAAHLHEEVLPQMQSLLVNNTPHQQVANKREIPFITYHAAYQYFLGRFHLAHEGEITSRPEDYMGAKTLDHLLASAKEVHVRCVIGEVNNSLVTRIAALSGAKVIILSPEQNIGAGDVPPLAWLHDDYDRLLYKTAKSFGGCL